MIDERERYERAFQQFQMTEPAWEILVDRRDRSFIIGLVDHPVDGEFEITGFGVCIDFEHGRVLSCLYAGWNQRCPLSLTAVKQRSAFAGTLCFLFGSLVELCQQAVRQSEPCGIGRSSRCDAHRCGFGLGCFNNRWCG